MNSLVNEEPEIWLGYLRLREQCEPAPDLNMQTVFHFAAPRAKEQRSLAWAEVAIRAAELEARSCTGIERDNALNWAMGLRSWFIARMGPQSSNIVLDKEIIISWIMDGLNISLSSVEKRASVFWENFAKAKESGDPSDLSRNNEDLHELRSLKRRLDIVKILSDSGHLEDNSTLTEWLKIREYLP